MYPLHSLSPKLSAWLNITQSLYQIQAARKGLAKLNYAWIIYGWYSEDWWVSDVESGCTNEEMEGFLDEMRPIVIQQYPTHNDLQQVTVSGVVS